MKLFLFICSFIVIAMNSYAQNYMDDIAKKTCACVENIPDNVDTEEFNIKLGLCVLEISIPYKKQIRKDYDIDLDNIGNYGSKWGQIVGMRMASECPDKLISLSQKVNSEPGTNIPLPFQGTIVKIEKEFFVVFSIKDEFGKITRYYWLTYINSEMDLISEYESLIGKTAGITYEVQELFDPRISEYRSFYVIKSFGLLD